MASKDTLKALLESAGATGITDRDLDPGHIFNAAGVSDPSPFTVVGGPEGVLAKLRAEGGRFTRAKDDVDLQLYRNKGYIALDDSFRMVGLPGRIMYMPRAIKERHEQERARKVLARRSVAPDKYKQSDDGMTRSFRGQTAY